MLPVGTEGDAADDAGVTAKRVDRFAASRRVPKFDGVVLAAGGDPPAVTADCHSPDLTGMAAQG